MIDRNYSTVCARLPALFASLVLGLTTATTVQAYSGGYASGGTSCASCHNGTNASTSVMVNTGTSSVVQGAPLTLNVTVANSSAIYAGFNSAVYNAGGGAKVNVASTGSPPGPGVQVANGEFTHSQKPALANGAATFTFVWKTPDTIPVGTYTIKTVGLGTRNGFAGDAQWNTGNDLTVTVLPPPTPPAAPTSVSAVAGNAQATVSFTAPTVDGGAPVTGFMVIANPGGVTATGPASPITIFGLSNDTPYTFIVRANNAVGAGAASAVSNSVVPTAPPSVATGVSATAGNGQATVSFTAPSGATSFTVTSSPGAITATGSGSPIVVTGLTNGTHYTFTVTPVGTGAPASATSNAVIPNPGGFAVPDPPSALGANGGNQMAVIAFSQPFDGGTPIRTYTALCNYSLVQGVTLSFTASSPTPLLIITGLQNGVTYKCGLTATNDVGTSIAPNPLTYGIGFIPLNPGPPSQPAAIAAIPGNGQATISFGPPTNDGGSAILDYTASCTDGSATFSATDTASPLTVTGLTNGTSYACRASARNAQGAFYQFLLYSVPVNVTPALVAVPGPPTGVSAIAGNAQASISFAPPTSAGGGAISAYTVTSSPGNITATGVGSPVNVTGLANGTAYTFTVTATNSLGTGPASSASNSVTPNATVVTAPDSPNCCSFVDAGNGMAILAFDPPADNGSPISGYSAICSYSLVQGVTLSLTANGPASPLIIGGVTNGTTYQCKLTATNAAGTSPVPAFATAQFTPYSPAPPSMPTSIVVSPGNGQVSIAFGAPANDGGSAILDYTASCRSGSTTLTATGPASPLTVTGLTNGTPYACWVTARNAQGTFGSLAYRSPAIGVTPAVGVVVPGAPTGVSASLSGGNIVMTWNAVSGATSYNIYMANQSGVTKTNYASLTGGHVHVGVPSGFAHPNPTPGATYYLVVTALNSAGESANSTEFSIAVPPTGTTTSSTTTTSTTTTTATTTSTTLASSNTVDVVASWNLLGNGMSNAIAVASIFGNSSQVTTVWKWVAGATPGWAFYTPTLGDGGAAYAANNGYSFLTTINAGEGFWVNAKVPFTVQLSGNAVTTSSFADGLTANVLPAGWSLIAIGDDKTPSGFANAIALNPPAAGTAVATSLTTLWAWDATLTGWYFFAPSLVNASTQANYIATKSYLDFGAKTLTRSTGFWVNHP